MLINNYYNVLAYQRVRVMIFRPETDPRQHIPIPGARAGPPQLLHNVESFPLEVFWFGMLPMTEETMAQRAVD